MTGWYSNQKASRGIYALVGRWRRCVGRGAGTALKISVIALCLFVQNSTFFIFFWSSAEWLLYKQAAYMQIDTGNKLQFAGFSKLKGARSSYVSS
jgi:hypothetical protein